MDWFWRNRRLLSAQRAELVAEIRARAQELDEEYFTVSDPAMLDVISRRRDRATALADWHEQRELRSRAARLGIVIPAEQLHLKADKGEQSLTEDGVLWLQREIRNTRFADTKRFVDMLTPILSFLISLGSLLVAWAALHMKK